MTYPGLNTANPFLSSWCSVPSRREENTLLQSQSGIYGAVWNDTFHTAFSSLRHALPSAFDTFVY